MKRILRLVFMLGVVGIGCYGTRVESVSGQEPGEIAVLFHDWNDPALLAEYTPVVILSLLDDNNDILSKIEAHREQSKPELEPLVKQYMHVTEALTKLATTGQKTNQSEQEQLVRQFTTLDIQIQEILDAYQVQLDALIKQRTVRTLTCSDITEPCRIPHILPGRYRLYGIITFSTTTLRWFEPIHLKGGDRRTVTLARENLMNPYWTELNWWSFINLDFSKHH